ncbi:IS1 family transposase [Epilithonimonas lactis]|uniref:IS1 family transposase n=1 Tax=Epilithonimonas lactis TaxID=421072 RepID=UPI00068E76B7|nr:IS1 family transposase [Epilithonimonas lactis]SEQ67390.1 Transposase and inactivated derivatives, IS1 family [Epilithonimonas lactis]
MNKRRNQCIHCNYSYCIKAGITSQNKQRYQCKKCKKKFIGNYSYRAYHKNTNHNIQQLIKEGVGIRGISRLLDVSKTTVLRKILKIASKVVKPPIPKNITIEIDELKTYTQSKTNERWVVAAYCRETKKVIDYKLGRRTTKTIQCIINTLLYANPKKIYSDRLNIYPKLIPKHLHSTKRRETNHIERKFLDLRTHIKRLGRKSINKAQRDKYTDAILKIYFWGISLNENKESKSLSYLN